ncbi:transcription factor AP-1 [Nephila pilipes]|uniref:Transcription factor AP-1 n=1 Tax=Nephila pilipes TaxID=299642 RepID=A0A8X6NGA0_NEPPI|nr:transcription factor AP-1 [Nephila pilipes]
MSRSTRNEGKSLKRPVTLNLDSPDSAAKKQRFASILTSPDLQMLKLASPELEKFIISNGNITTTPTPTQFLFSKNVTEEQEQYARGFIDALNQLHQTPFEFSPGELLSRFRTGTTPVLSNPPEIGSDKASNANSLKMYSGLPSLYFQPTTSVIKSPGTAKYQSVVKPTLVVRPPSVDNNSSNSCNSMSSNSTTLPLEIAIKEELQTVPNTVLSTPPLSPICKGPIDMVDQERIKLERKRYRNRLAASKCRRRKLEKIAQLEDKVKELKGENTKLELVVDKLRQHICLLKEEVLEHAKKGCQIMLTKV